MISSKLSVGRCDTLLRSKWVARHFVVIGFGVHCVDHVRLHSVHRNNAQMRTQSRAPVHMVPFNKTLLMEHYA